MEKEKTIKLFGTIGEEIDGNAFALMLSEADSKYETINLQINSFGGSVGQGYSILSTMLTMKSKVNVTIVGVAASMAAVIAVCGNHVYMNDYSRLMIHDPFFPDTDNKELTPEDKKTLENIRGSLCTILSRRGCENKDVSKLMREETWFTADEALAKGFIDSIISTKKQEYKNLATDDIYSCISASFVKTSKQKVSNIIKDLGTVLGIKTSSEDDILNVVYEKIIQTQIDLVMQKLNKSKQTGTISADMFESMKKMCDKDPDTVLNFLNANEENRRNQSLEQHKDKFNGVPCKSREALIQLSKTNLELFNEIIPLIGGMTSLGKWIESGEGNNKGRSRWTLDDYRRDAPEELKKNPELYQRLIKEEEKRTN